MVKPKKKFGQHFLKDQNVISKIVEKISEKGFKSILEIGPGAAALTDALVMLSSAISVCEIDSESVDYLKNKFHGCNNIEIFHRDFLEAKSDFLDKFDCICGNLPYNISSPIFFKLLEETEKFSYGIFMLQKEVADRIYSIHGNKTYGILSVLVQSMFDVNFLFDVPPEAFFPPPKVQSAVIEIHRKEKQLTKSEFTELKKIVKAAFGMRRKTLRNAMKAVNIEVRSEFANKRAEQLSVSDYLDWLDSIKKA